jgi:hypothetical protein
MLVFCRATVFKEGHTACSPAWSAVEAPCWAVADAGSDLLGSRGAYGASGRRSFGRDLLVGQVFHDGNVQSLQKDSGSVTKRIPRSCDLTAQSNWKQLHIVACTLHCTPDQVAHSLASRFHDSNGLSSPKCSVTRTVIGCTPHCRRR